MWQINQVMNIMNYTHFLQTIKIIVLLLLFIQLPFQSTYGKTPIPEKGSFRFLEMNITQIQQGYKDGKFTIKEVVQAYLNRIENIDKNGPALHSIILVNPDAIRIATELDKEMKQSKKIRGPLFGIPVVLKDNIDTHDNMPCTAGSRALMNSFPLKDSYVAKKLREAGKGENDLEKLPATIEVKEENEQDATH